MNGELLRLIDAIHRDKDIDKEVLFDGIEQALLTAPDVELGRRRCPVPVRDGAVAGHPLDRRPERGPSTSRPRVAPLARLERNGICPPSFLPSLAEE